MKLNWLINQKIRFLCFAALSVFCLTKVNYAQALNPTLSKQQALNEVKVKSVKGWREVISDQGRFRVIFPGEAVIPDDDVASVHGLRLNEDKMKWSASYSDLYSSVNDDSQIRDSYRRSIEAITKSGSKLIRQTEIILNGKLGDEVILRNQNSKSFMRAFLINNRLYILGVEFKDSHDESDEIPKDVQQFFDSFTFWLSTSSY